METWADVLVFQALEIPYLSNLNQMGFLMEVLDFLQQSNTVITNWISNNPLKISYYILEVKIQL